MHWTVLADIPKVSPAYLEEVFGPVALLFRVDDIVISTLPATSAGPSRASRNASVDLFANATGK